MPLTRSFIKDLLQAFKIQTPTPSGLRKRSGEAGVTVFKEPGGGQLESRPVRRDTSLWRDGSPALRAVSLVAARLTAP